MFNRNLGKELANWYEPLDRKAFLKAYNGDGSNNVAVMEHHGFPVNQDTLPHGLELMFDIECYKNYFLCTFYHQPTESYWEYEKRNEGFFNAAEVLLILMHNTIVTFNGLGYDLPIVNPALLNGASNMDLFKVSKDIIVDKKMKHRNQLDVDHIDIAPILPLQASMKMYGCRSKFQKLAELPVDPMLPLTDVQMDEVRDYCRVDVRLTHHLKCEVIEQLELRVKLSEQYGMDLRSKSDPEIAESLISHFMSEHGKPVTKRTKKVFPFSYRVPSWVEFKSPEFKAALEKVKQARFVCNKDGYIDMPEELHNAFEFDGMSYQFGIGGIHSQESGCVTIPTETQRFGEFDVGSMYPSIIIEQGLYPQHLDPVFLDMYTSVRDERLVAKKSDPIKAQTYKIVLNSSYGKFGSKYSFLYSPELLIQTTVTGQLSLLMLIERMTLAGGKVVSANTDGVNVLFDTSIEDEIFAVQKWWENVTTYLLEFTEYSATYNRDVNNYIAVKKGGGVKGKGAYGDPSLSKNPQTPIVNVAILSHITDGVPFEETIRNETDPFMFTSCQKVSGGAKKDGEDIGYIARWYYSTSTTTPIRYAENGNTVSKTEGAQPALDLPEKLWDDIDYAWYIAEANKKYEALFTTNK